MSISARRVVASVCQNSFRLGIWYEDFMNAPSVTRPNRSMCGSYPVLKLSANRDALFGVQGQVELSPALLVQFAS